MSCGRRPEAAHNEEERIGENAPPTIRGAVTWLTWYCHAGEVANEKRSFARGRGDASAFVRSLARYFTILARMARSMDAFRQTSAWHWKGC